MVKGLVSIYKQRLERAPVAGVSKLGTEVYFPYRNEFQVIIFDLREARCYTCTKPSTQSFGEWLEARGAEFIWPGDDLKISFIAS